MNCKLCGQDATLVKSHIIPDFMYSGIFDSKHFMAKVDVASLNQVGKIPTGVYDKNILCKTCDNELISDYETYGSKVFFDGKFSKDETPEVYIRRDSSEAGVMHLKNINYQKLKLFYISIWFRIQITSQNFFSGIHEDKYTDRLRQMLLNQDAGSEDEFKTATILYDKQFIPAKSLVPPTYFELAGVECLFVHINSRTILFKLDRNKTHELFEIGNLRKDGTVNFLHLNQGKLANSLFSKWTKFKL
jgi:hypothetical protein